MESIVIVNTSAGIGALFAGLMAAAFLAITAPAVLGAVDNLRFQRLVAAIAAEPVTYEVDLSGLSDPTEIPDLTHLAVEICEDCGDEPCRVPAPLAFPSSGALPVPVPAAA